MSLALGTRLGPYEITAPLGAGGMGEVYRATDTKLKRQVAIKVLPESVAGDPERLARLQREAEVLASLNHPNIAAIYGLEEADSTRALVMELVEGPTLADLIAAGSPEGERAGASLRDGASAARRGGGAPRGLSLDDALAIAWQIADALEAAHEQGIIHRDLKPANIKVRPDGTVKVLDFGLAKALEPAGAAASGVSASMSPTITTPAMTQAGLILGTAAYMSPEQAKGRQVDARADVWAFGAVLFEMLTGRRAFDGDDVTEIMGAVVRLEPDWEALPSGFPARIRQTLRGCLQKDVKRRIAHIHDARLALEGAFDAPAPPPAEPAAVARPTGRPSWPLLAATASVAIVATGLVAWALRPASEPGMVRRFATVLPEGLTFRNLGRPILALAPDASAVVYNTTGGLYLRTADALDAQLMPGTEASLTSPVFSPDGQQVAYWDVEGRLERIGRAGGAPVVVASGITNPLGLSWAADGTLLVGQPDGIYQVPATGGTPELIIPAREGERLYGAQLLPDGESVLFSAATSGWDEAEIVVQARGRDDRTVLVEGGSDPRYVATGHLVYALGDGLFGMAFDPERRTVSGGAVPLVQGVRRAGSVTGAAQYSVSATGELTYVPGGIDAGRNTLVWVDRGGREDPLAIAPGDYVYPRLSPDGTRVALDDRNDAGDLWVWDLALETRTRLIVGEAGGQYPAWAPDGTRLAFYENAGGIALKAANNTGSVERLATSSVRTGSPNIAVYFFTPDGTALVFARIDTPSTGQDIGLIALEDGAEPAWLLEETFNERNAELSPDGRWMAYESDESGQFEIYVRPFPNVDDDRVQVSNAGGTRPLWSRDGRELLYLDGQPGQPRALMSAAVRTGDVFTVEARTRVMDWPYFAGSSGALGRTYDVSPDGGRLLAITQGDGASDTSDQVIVVEHWFEELRRLVPRN